MKATLLLTAGRGPAECQRAVVCLAELLRVEARAAGLTAAPDPSTPERMPSLVLDIAGPGALDWARRQCGPVQWIAPSPYRPAHPRRNWFVQVSLLDRGAFLRPTELDSADITFTAIRSGGPGGQRRNKVATAVRAEHRLTGRVVVASEERSLAANRTVAIERLRALAVADHHAGEAAAAHDQWSRHDRVERGNPTRRIVRPL